jgi:orotidine-5'-phosphate decarboxylase
MISFAESVQNMVEKNRSFLCVGLDPDLKKIPPEFLKQSQPLFQFNKAIIDATKDFVCAYKPQIAYYAAQGAEAELTETIRYIQKLKIPVILDSKRGDIGETAEMYAQEAFVRYGADAVTVNPYMGGETLEPYLNYDKKGVIVLCKTSNPGSGDLQDLRVDGTPLYEIVAQKAVNQWNKNKNIMLVVGATHVEPLAKIRKIVGDMTLLVPGVGAQGGDLKSVLKVGLTAQKRGLIINSSRAILYAKGGANLAESSFLATQEVVKQMRDFL